VATKGDVEHLQAANDSIQAAFAAGSSHGVLKATTNFYEILFSVAGRPVAWGVVQSLMPASTIFAA